MEAITENISKKLSRETQYQVKGDNEKNKGKENNVLTNNSPATKIMNKSSLTPDRRKSGSPLSMIRNFAALSNRGSPSRTPPNKGSPFAKFFGKVSYQEYTIQSLLG